MNPENQPHKFVISDKQIECIAKIWQQHKKH